MIVSTVKALRGGIRVTCEANSGLLFTPKFSDVTVNADAVFVMEKEHVHQDFLNIVIFLWTRMRTVLCVQAQTSY